MKYLLHIDRVSDDDEHVVELGESENGYCEKRMFDSLRDARIAAATEVVDQAQAYANDLYPDMVADKVPDAHEHAAADLSDFVRAIDHFLSWDHEKVARWTLNGGAEVSIEEVLS